MVCEASYTRGFRSNQIGMSSAQSNNDYAGFDPIFYLHHANIDRILALWEYIYPNYWMGEGYRDKEGKLIKFGELLFARVDSYES